MATKIRRPISDALTLLRRTKCWWKLRTSHGWSTRAILASWTRWRLSLSYPLRNPTESVGAYGERIASIFLERQGFIVLEKSYRLKSGEIDVIAVWQRRIVVFVEVKTWSECRDNSGGPSDAVDAAKQEKISKTAMTYMKRHRLLESAGRADVIEVVLGNKPGRPNIRHFENAFEAVGKFQMFT